MICRPTHITLPAASSGVPRSPGLHLSDVIGYICRALKYPPFDKLDADPDLVLRDHYFRSGFAWERALELGLGEQAGLRPGELSLDGIAGSPDGFLTDINDDFEEVDFLIENKLTWKSSKLDPTEMQHWMMQVKGYCKMAGLNWVRFYVFHVNGDYKPPRPCTKFWELYFTQAEVDQNWKMILNNREEAWNAVQESFS